MKHKKTPVSKKRHRNSLVDVLRRELQGPEFAPASRLPSCREWSNRLGVSYSSVHRALCELQKAGLVHSRNRSGWFIPPTAVSPGSAKPRRIPVAERPREVVIPFLSEGDENYLTDRAENWSGTILSSISRTLGQNGMRLSLLSDPSPLDSHSLPERTIRLLESMPQMPAGVVMFAQPGLEAFRGWLKQRGIPNLTIGIPNDSTTTNFVSTNFREMGRVAGVAFGNCGFDRVVYLYGDFHLLPAERQRLEGLCSGFAETTGRLPAALGFGYAANSPREFGRRAMVDHLKRAEEPPQAVFAAGDYLAIGAIQALQEFGLHCPEQVVVLGTTGLDFAGLTSPSITTIDQPMHELGKRTAETLLQMLDNPERDFPGIILPSRITFRESFPGTADLVEALRIQFPHLGICHAATTAPAVASAAAEP